MLCVLPHTNRTCPATNQVVAGSRKVVLLFATKSVHILLVQASDVNPVYGVTTA